MTREELKALAEKAGADIVGFEISPVHQSEKPPGLATELFNVWAECRNRDGSTDESRFASGMLREDAEYVVAANPATVLSLLAALEEAEGREKARVDKVEKIGCRAAELTFDWLCGEFEDLPNKLAEDMSVKITDSIIWALGEGSVIDDFADAEQQVLELRARAEASEQREAGLRGALDWFGQNENLSLEFDWSDADTDGLDWVVYRENGGRNDREWTVVASGPTPQAAILAAYKLSGATTKSGEA